MIRRRDNPRTVLALATFVLAAVPLRPWGRSDPARLAALLAKAAAYCQRLDRAALDFVCLEEVTETTFNLSPDTNVYLYDYQFVRKGAEARERRNLVSINGKKADSRDTALHSAYFQYKNALFGPIGLLSRFWQSLLVYELVGEDTVLGEPVVVVAAAPGPDLDQPHPTGRLWIRESDGSVLKIVWDQRSLGNFKMIEEWAREHEAEPLVTSYTEYGSEKNGLRFPSRSYTEQAYLRQDRGKSASAEISVVYKDYRFFTVETQTVY